VTLADDFAIAAPEHVAPGSTAYLLVDELNDEYPLSAFQSVDADVYYDRRGRPPADPLSVSNT
jgi:hypothetical protein